MRGYRSFVLLLVGLLVPGGRVAVAEPCCVETDCHCSHWPGENHPWVLEIRDCPGYGMLGEVRCVWDQYECGDPASDWYPCWRSGENKPPDECFLAGTAITMADGSTLSIEDVRPTDRVMAFEEKSERSVPAEVRAVHPARVSDGYLVVNGTIRMTRGQPVLSRGRWVAARDLRIGDSLTAPDGRGIPVTSVQAEAEPVTVYNLDLGQVGTYVAAGIVVHNKHLHYTLEPCFNCGP